MNLKKLIPALVTGLQDAGFAENPTKIQSASVAQIKSGVDLYVVAPTGTGKTTAIATGIIQRLKDEFEVAPRAIVMVASKEKAFELEEQFEVLAKHTDLRVFTVFDQGIIQYQRDIIYEGLDILIGTPKRLNELLKVNGIRLTQVKMLVVDDLNAYRLEQYSLIYHLAESIPRSQFVMVADVWNKNFEKFNERIMKSPKIIKVD
jgi:ATP-dependent RNA helicase RhlE